MATFREGMRANPPVLAYQRYLRPRRVPLEWQQAASRYAMRHFTTADTFSTMASIASGGQAGDPVVSTPTCRLVTTAG
jgi:hypothetical protein